MGKERVRRRIRVQNWRRRVKAELVQGKAAQQQPTAKQAVDAQPRPVAWVDGVFYYGGEPCCN